MNASVLPPPTSQEFSREQKEYLSGFMAGVTQAGWLPYVGTTSDGQITASPTQGGKNLADTGDLTKQEKWKADENPLDIWDKLLAHAEENKFPDEADAFRFRYHGLFHVAPAQNSFMLRCRIPAGELTFAQLQALADIADDWGNGYSDITTRSNIQIREIQPRNIINVLTKLQELGLTARGSGVDNIRNITASPTAGIDPIELIDTRPLAKALHHYILNHRDLYGLPRKFNVAFDGGGSVSVVADTNDIGFIAVRTQSGVGFRLQLAGITGHKQLARDAGILVKPSECLAVAVAIIRVFAEHGDRTDRKKARLKYLIDNWGIPKFLEVVQKKLAFPLAQIPLSECQAPPAPIKHGHVGIFRQAQPRRNYVGVVIPVGRMDARQMRRLAGLAQNYGSGEVRLTPWQNLLIPNIADAFVETVKRNLVRMGFHYESTAIAGGLVACTGNVGCKYASTNTKAHAVELARYLEKKVSLQLPLNIHFTGCPHSCAQHYIGDIGLLGVKTMLGGASVEGYNVALGGGYAPDGFVAQDVFKGIPFSSLPQLLERVLRVYKEKCRTGETLAQFTRRHEVKELQEMFSE